MVLGVILAAVFTVIFAACAGFSIYQSVRLVKTQMIEVDYKGFFKKNGLFLIASTISFIVASFGFCVVFRNLQDNPASFDALHIIELVVGAILFGGCLFTAINAFIVHYYGRNIPKTIDKWLFRILLIGFTVSVVGFFFWTSGLAPFLKYPLPNGISFTEGLVSPASTGRPNIAFYAICILSGAIFVYFLCDHYMYKEYGQHGTLESTFFVAFPAGIVGARIWYVVGNWSKEFANGAAMTTVGNGFKIWAPLAIWEGGLTILGGAVMGILVGAIWYMWRNKGKSILLAVDICVPTILIAQAIGRWGNFFNCEVHGLAINVDNWKWLPEIIWRNAQFSSTGPSLVDANQMYLPLFFVEFITNLLGYFVIAHVFGKALRKYTELGDLGAGYIIWYGLTRVLLEPLRSPEYQMGEEGYWSWVWSIIFVLIGTLVIVANHVIRYVLKKKKNEYIVKKNDVKVGLFSSMIIAALAAFLIDAGVILMISNKFEVKVTYNAFNIGLILLVLGISVLLGLVLSFIKLFEALRKKKANE